MIRIVTTFVCLIVFNFIAFWITKVVVDYSLSINLHTEFSRAYVTNSTFAAGFIFATIYAFFIGVTFTKRRGEYR